MSIFRMALVVVILAATTVYAGEADVVGVKVKEKGENLFYFSVSVHHDDEGWDHYANKWDVVAPEGIVLGTRILHHPHVNEQPFTRSLSGLKIPDTIETVTIRVHDSVHDYGGKTITIKVPK